MDTVQCFFFQGFSPLFFHRFCLFSACLWYWVLHPIFCHHCFHLACVRPSDQVLTTSLMLCQRLPWMRSTHSQQLLLQHSLQRRRRQPGHHHSRSPGLNRSDRNRHLLRDRVLQHLEVLRQMPPKGKRRKNNTTQAVRRAAGWLCKDGQTHEASTMLLGRKRSAFPSVTPLFPFFFSPLLFFMYLCLCLVRA